MAMPYSRAGSGHRLAVGDDLLGRVINGAGQPLDGLGAYAARQRRPLDGPAPLALERLTDS